MFLYLTDPKRKNTGFDSERAKRTVELLSDEGFLDDKRYLKLLLRKMDLALFGPRKIRETLVRHRFPPRFVEAAMARSVDFSQRAILFLQKMGKAEELVQSPEGRKKLVDTLVRRGYDYSSARFAVDEISEDDTVFSD
jgi:SOS response regulatory protein OraA/RecX